MKHLLLLSLLFLLPGMTIDSEVQPPVLPRAGKDFALFFAVKDYNSWKDLSGPIQDAKAIATELKTHYGFDTLIVRNPTLDQIYAKLEEYQRKAYAADAQLLIFFSGHGAFLENSNLGFFIPKEGNLREKDPRFNSALPHAILSSYVESIPCRHILLAIDACYSGTFSRDVAFKGDEDERPGGPDPEAELQAKIKTYLEPKTRLFLTSGGKERTPDPSDFAARFLQGLQSNRRSGKRLLTVSQLYTNHLEEATPKPKYGAFGDNGYESNFIFVYTPPQQAPSSVAPDRDADGTPDAADQCPDEYGLTSTYGCPDADEDGVPDKSDKCEYLRGEKKWQGCPDSDTDGIPDHEDPCPNQRGPIGGNGCPTADRDGDGVPDSGDACPDQAGPARFRGCPDSDGDNVPDNDDKCPQEKGDPGNNGCPILYTLGLKPGDFVKIMGGTFQMGSTENDDEKPVHAVSVSDFYLNKYEVTVAQFKIFVEESGYKTDAENGDGSYVYTDAGSFEKKAGINWRHDAQGNLRPSSQHNHPVIHVSWNDATAYCQWLSRKTGQTYRLPTEAEWEYAAGNGMQHTKYSWGNGNPSGRNGGNVADEALKRKYSNWSYGIFTGYDDGNVFTAPVGSFNANTLGLFDMTGNVWEWCQDYYDENYYQSSPSRDPQGPASGSTRVVRGGSWFNNPNYSRVADRDRDFPDNRNNDTGFRVLRR